ncbi:MAG: primosomal protein N', partial [Acutalibacteraceae bacterium]
MTEVFLVAEVAVENTAYHFDKLYDYIVPTDSADFAKAGCRVMISFGRGSLRQGIIMSLHKTDDVTGLKKISELLDKEPVLSEELLLLAKSMKERCYCTLFEACAAMLPPGLSLKVTYSYTITDIADETSPKLSDIEKQIITYLRTRKVPVRQDRLLKALGLSEDSVLVKMTKNGLLSRTEAVKKRLQDITVKMVRLVNDDVDVKLSPRQSDVINILRAAGSVSRKEICYFTGVSTAVTDTLVKKGICEYFDEEPPKVTDTENIISDKENIVLTPQQEKAYNSLIGKYESGNPSVSLLYGITGSGKTSVFMKLIDRANADGKGVICMVPEIALTPQLLSKFKARYGNNVAVFHSGLSLSKRLEEWKRVKNGEATIAVGTRSAIFAPMENIGLIVIDEEQEYTYKSSSVPRFHARDLAKIRCSYNNCLLLLSSATPSVESSYYAQQGRYSLETLTSRYGKAKLPYVITVDMNLEQQQGNMSNYSSVLLEAIDDNLEHGHQSIILLNRRGHNTFVSCRQCREVISCPNCSISLTYHSANNRLMCHYCGYSIPAPSECPYCHSPKIRYSGSGTQRAEQEIQEI